MLQAMTLLLVCQLIGEVAVRALAVAIPGPVLGMLLMFTVLCGVRRVPEQVGSTADNLLGHLSILFVPAGVGVMSHQRLLGDEWLPILVAVAGSTVVALMVTAGVLRWWPKPGRRHE